MSAVYISHNLTGRPVLSLKRTVAALIEEKGPCNVEQVHKHFPEYSREQLMKAMHNAGRDGLIHCYGRQARKGGPPGGSAAVTYYPGPKPERTTTARHRVRSVWELGLGG